MTRLGHPISLNLLDRGEKKGKENRREEDGTF